MTEVFASGDLNGPRVLGTNFTGITNDAVDNSKDGIESSDDEVINVFSLATGHLYERFLKIMMLSVTKRTSVKVKFWLFENFLSPKFKASATAMAERIGCEVEFVTYICVCVLIVVVVVTCE